MTREEAINKLNSLKDYYNDKNEDFYVGFDDEDNEAVDMAIKALEQTELNPSYSGVKTELNPYGDCISRDSVLDLAKQGVLISNGSYESVCKAINELPPVMPKIQEWLSSFNTDSATECFTAVQELRKKIKTN